MQNIYSNIQPDLAQGDVYIFDDETITNERLYSDENLTILGFLTLSYTCDLTNKRINFASLCPVLSLRDFVLKLKKGDTWSDLDEADITNKTRGVVTELMKYKPLQYFFLPKRKLWEDHGVALLENIQVFTLDKVERNFKKFRVFGLKSPWKEKLGWKVGNLFNRVALTDHSDTKMKKVSLKIAKEIPRHQT